MTKTTKLALIAGACLVAGAILLPLLPPRVVRSHASCLTNLRMIAGAKETWAQEHHKTSDDGPTWEDLAVGPNRYIKEMPACPTGGTYTIGRVGELPRCSFPEHAAKYKDSL